MAASETLNEHRKSEMGSDRNFGLVFAGVCVVMGLWPLVFRHAPPHWWALGAGAGFLGLALAAPGLLAPLNRLWYRFGLLLHKIMQPLIMGLLYVVAIVPVGLALKLAGKDLLRLKREPEADSYWIPREPPAPKPGSMRKQF